MTTDTALFAAAKPGFTTISPDRSTVLSFDREGRLFSYFKGGATYRRTLDSTVEERWQEGRRQRRRLTPAEAVNLFAEAYGIAAGCLPRADATVQERLRSEILRWTPERLLAEKERFSEVYRPIAILPPDQYLSIVLQATEGCTWNRCTFCTFYQDRPFRSKTEEEFARHARAVRDFLSRGILMRKGIFLADGNALALSRARLEPIFAVARETFPGHDIYSFVDLYTGERRPLEEWRRLAHLGLKRVYIGMETGLDELLRFLNKPGSCEELVQFVSDLKQAGIAVGLIAMVGVGGKEFAGKHAEATLGALAHMPLSQGDLIYLSPFIEHPGSVYAERRAEEGLTPLSESEIASELARWAQEIRRWGFKAARYDIREFLY